MSVTQGIYFFHRYCLPFLQVDSQVDARPVGWYGRLFSFFEDIQLVVIFSGDCLSYILVFVVVFVFYCQFSPNVDSFQLNFIFDFIPS